MEGVFKLYYNVALVLLVGQFIQWNEFSIVVHAVCITNTDTVAAITSMIQLETKAMTSSSHCNTGRMCVTLPIITRENTSLAIHVVQKITIIRVQKIGNFAV